MWDATERRLVVIPNHLLAGAVTAIWNGATRASPWCGWG